MAEEPSSNLAPPPGKISRQRTSSLSDDYNVYKTNDDATESKRAAVNLGYWRDPYIEQMWPHETQKKDPEINRGYWARVHAIQILLKTFLKTVGPKAQIISLGAGYDTLYWQLVDLGLDFSRYVEVDFSSVTAKKIHHIMKAAGADLKRGISADGSCIVSDSHIDLHGPRFNLVGADLRQTKELYDKLKSTGIEWNNPTVIICECVLIYMTNEQSANLLTFLSDHLPNALFINYEQVNLDDKFGEVMQENLYTRGICLAGTKACQNFDSQVERFHAAGWPDVKIWSMTDIYDKKLPRDQIQRIEKLEFLDEKELLSQLLDHYCIVLASKGKAEIELKTIDFP